MDVLGFCLAALLLFRGCHWFVLLDEIGLKSGLALLEQGTDCLVKCWVAVVACCCLKCMVALLE